LHQVLREAATGSRVADKLFQVWRKDGEEAWVLSQNHHENTKKRKHEMLFRGFSFRAFVFL
jgi:hypothetical protein